MFDLNEIPEQPVTEPGAENGGNAVDGVTIWLNIEDSTPSSKSLSLPSPTIKDDGAIRVREAASAPMEIPASKCSVPSSMSLEMTSSKRPNVSTSIVPALWQRDPENEDHGIDNAMAVEGFALQNQLHHHHQHVSAGKPARDLIDNTPKVAFHFLMESADDASTSRALERFVDGPAGNEQEKGLTRTITPLKNTAEPQASSEGYAFGLSLGGVFRKSPSPHGAVSLVRHPFKAPDLYANALGIEPEQIPLASRKSTLLSPFWHGKLQTGDTPLRMPIVAYCLGIMTPDSRLKKLPSVLTLKKFLKLEELERILRKGIAEPLTQFKPSEEASLQEVKRFQSLVKSLSTGSGPGLDMCQQGFSADRKSASLAALISCEGDSLDAKLCLVSFPSIQGVYKFCKSSLIIDALEDMNALDSELLYGVICHSTSGALNEKNDSLPSSKSQRAGRTTISSSNKVSVTLEANVAPAERGKEAGATNRNTSPSNRKHHVNRSDLLTKSASMEPLRITSRDDFDLEEAGKETKKRYQKQLSAIDKIHEPSGKHHSTRYGNGTRDLDEDDVGMLRSKQRERFNWNYGRTSQRQEWRSDRLKDSVWWSKDKDDRDSHKQTANKHQRYIHHDGEKGKERKSQGTEGDQGRNQDRSRNRERERPKDSIAEDMRLKLSAEKSLAGSKKQSDQDTGKINKKRDRESEKEHVSVKRSRESAPLSLHSEQLVKNTSRDLKSKLEVEQTKGQSPKNETVPGENPDFPMYNKETRTLDTRVSNLQRYDGIVEAIDMDLHVLNEKTTTLVQKDGSVGEEINGPTQAFVSTLGACETISSSNPVVPSLEEKTEDGAISKSDEILGDSLLDKVKCEKEDIGVEFSLDVFDKETRTWLLSKQNALYLQEEFGVETTISSDVSSNETDPKTDTQAGPLQVKISVIPTKPCDASENKWFLDQAATMVKSIAVRGVFIKCLWYEGPVQIHPGDGAPSVPVIVKKIKGEDGKNLERVQDMTGVMIGVVLRKCGTGALHEMESVSRPRFIGLRLKCIRRKGLLEALKETEALLECVADHFSKELATHIATHIVDLQTSNLHPNEAMSNEGSPSATVIATKELLPNLPVKEESSHHDSPGSFKLDEVGLFSPLQDFARKVPFCKEEPEATLPIEQEVASRPLYVSNLPDHMTPIKIQNIFENALRQKLEPSVDVDDVPELVADVRYEPEKSCAFVVLANDGLLNATLKVYAEDKLVFQGMSVELNPSEHESAFSRLGTRVMGGVHRKAVASAMNEEDNNGRRYDAADNDSMSDCSDEQWCAENVTSRTDPFPGRPRPLFLSELMRNASALAIKQLFEDIITTYIGTSLVSAGGRQLVLDVRYVPSRGCAFVDLATPELVDFMLDLHSRRPEVFMNMKMELGRKAVAYSADEDTGGRLNIRLHTKPHFSSQQASGYRLSLPSRKKAEKRASGSFDLEDSDKGDDILWSNARLKKQRSDPEKTIYADRLPENASESMIKKIFERVISQKLTREEADALGEHLITEVRHVPTKYCAFVVFATEELTRRVLHLFNQDEDAFECMRLKPHFHSRMEDLYKDELQDIDDIVHTSSFRERMGNLDSDHARPRPVDSHEARIRSAAHRAITASAFREVDRRRSVYVDKIPEDLIESNLSDLFEKVFRHKKHGHDGPMVSQIAYFRDKFDPSKLCAFVEVKTEDGTQELVDYYNANQDAFQGMRVRPGFKYSN